MNVNSVAESLEGMSQQALSRYIKRCFCRLLDNASETDDGVDLQLALDLAHAECCRRQKERLYDMAYESVMSHPEWCNAA